MTDLDILKDAVGQSMELWKAGRPVEALRVLDELIGMAKQENRQDWVRILSRQAAVIANSESDLGAARRYCEQVVSLAPEDALTLCTLADILFRQGESGLAQKCAARSYALVAHSETEVGRGLVELLAKKWPEIDEWKV